MVKALKEVVKKTLHRSSCFTFLYVFDESVHVFTSPPCLVLTLLSIHISTSPYLDLLRACFFYHYLLPLHSHTIPPPRPPSFRIPCRQKPFTSPLTTPSLNSALPLHPHTLRIPLDSLLRITPTRPILLRRHRLESDTERSRPGPARWHLDLAPPQQRASKKWVEHVL